LTLADEVKRARERKIRLNKEREFLSAEKTLIKDRFAQLYRKVFQSLRDSDGQPYRLQPVRVRRLHHRSSASDPATIELPSTPSSTAFTQSLQQRK
jgi:hypothetical protein